VGYPLEERIHRSFSVGGHRWRNTAQPLLDRTLQGGFHVFTRQLSKPSRELVNLAGTDVHVPTIIT
jgi:hypothetical protein